MPQTDPEKRKETNRRSAAKRRSLASSAEHEAELEANRERNRKNRDAARPTPVTDVEILKDVLRFGPANPYAAGPKKVRTGPRVRDSEGVVARVDVARAVDHLPWLAEGVLGRGIDYDRAHNLGEPWWWNSDLNEPMWWTPSPAALEMSDAILLAGTVAIATGMPGRLSSRPFGRPNYSAHELRWVMYSFSFRRRNTSSKEGYAMELRGWDIATTLSYAPRDALWVANWLRVTPGRETVPRSARWTAAQAPAAMRWLKNAGILHKRGGEWWIG